MRSLRAVGVVGTVVALAAAVPALAVSPAAASSGSTTAGTCTVADATMSWGFKESFRSYISGTIAKGSWTTTDGATYATPSFGWSGGTGSIDEGATAGTVGWTGSVRFTGHGGILDTTVADPSIEVTGPTEAVLHLDVRGTTQDGAAIDERDVPFATLDLTGHPVDPSSGAVAIDTAAATLTQEGATAFGTYPAGTVLDPVSATVPVSCPTPTPTAVPVAPASPSATAVSSGDDADADARAEAGASDGGSHAVWIAAGIGAVVVAAVATVVVGLRRRRISTPSSDPGEAEEE